MGDLAEGMGAGVGAARAHRRDLLLQQGAQGRLQRPLHGPSPGLGLPAHEAGAVVFQVQTQGSPPGRGLAHHRPAHRMTPATPADNNTAEASRRPRRSSR